MFADHHHDDRVAVWCAAAESAQAALIESAPERYFRPPYVGTRGWVGLYLDNAPNWPDIEAILREAYDLIAAKK